MAELDGVHPSLPIRRIGPDDRRDAPVPEHKRRRRPPSDELTDDQGGEPHDEIPLIDDYA